MSLLRVFGRAIFVCLLLTTWAMGAECGQDHRSDKEVGILVTDFAITGNQTLSSAEIAGMTGELIGSCFNEDSDEIGERIRALYQDRGYMKAEVKSVHFKASDPLGIPKPVTIEAEVAEGPQYRFGEITFVKNHAFSQERLQQEFPLKRGDLFSRQKVAGGLEGLRKVYSSSGFLDFTAIPDAQGGSNALMNLTVTVQEGPQYHLEKVEFAAEKAVAGRLQMQWELGQGAVYDAEYIDKYIETNRDLLPAGFHRADAMITRNCPDALVQVRIALDPEEAAALPAPKNIPCEEHHDKSK